MYMSKQISLPIIHVSFKQFSDVWVLIYSCYIVYSKDLNIVTDLTFNISQITNHCGNQDLQFIIMVRIHNT